MEASDEVKETTATDLGALLDDGDGAVVTLVAGDTRLLAHRAVLAAGSAALAAELQQASSGSSGEVAVLVPGVGGTALRHLLACLYTRRAPRLPPAAAPQLLAAAHRYALPELKARCERQMVEQLTVETAAAAAVLAVRYSCDHLRRAAFSLVRAHTHEVMASQGWADAVRTQPEDVVRVCRLLLELPTETSGSCVSELSTVEPGEEVEETSTGDLGDLLDAGDGATVTLVAGDTRLVAHRAVLAARSPAMAAKLRHDTQEASSGQLAVPDVEGAVLRQLLAYLYTLRAPPPPPQLPGMAAQLLAAADVYGVAGLKAECERQVAAQLCVETAAAAAALAVRHSCDGLKRAAADFIKAHTLEVMASQGWADAVRTRPEDVVRVSRLLSELPTETGVPASEDSGASTAAQPQTDHGWTSTSAASLVASTTTPAPDVDAAVSRMLIHSVIAQATTASRPPLAGHSETPASAASPVDAQTTLTLDDAAASCACARASAASRTSAATHPATDLGQPRASAAPHTAAHTTLTRDDDVAISHMLIHSVLAQATTDSGTTTTGQPHVDSSSGQTPAVTASSVAPRITPPLDDATVSRMMVCSVIAQATTGTAATLTTLPHTDSSDDSPTPASACPRTVAQTTSTSDVSAVSWNVSDVEKGRRLIEAAKKGLVEEVRALLADGADVRTTDRSLTMWTALHWAADRGHVDVVQCLLAAGAEVDARNRLLQNTPLHYAAWRGHVAVVQLLLASSADPNARSVDGRTPLHFAAYNDHAETVTVLLEAGADKGAKSMDGHTALDLAREYRRLQAIAVLR